MGVWSSSTTVCCCSPTRRTPPSTSASTSSRCSSASEERRVDVREGRREVLCPRQPSAFLGRQPGELAPRGGGVRQGLDRVLPRLPGPRPGLHALAHRALPEVLGRGLREG